jgi:hypothetical protein
LCTQLISNSAGIFLDDCGPKKERFWYSHVDLICCVSTNHVVYHQMSTWMLVDPAIELQRVSFVDDDQLAVCD